MKKILFIIISFFLWSYNVVALPEGIYLTNLEILNGVNTLSFDPLCDIYTINVTDLVTSLDIKYTTSEEDVSVTISGNESLNYGTNDVYINLNKGDVTNTYHLIVNRYSDTETAFMEITPEVIESKVNNYTIPLLTVCWFVINLILFYFLFLRHKH